MTEPKRIIVSHDATFECETCGVTKEVTRVASISDFKKEVQVHQELGHQGNVSYAPWYLEEDYYTGKHSLEGGL